jgi:hypothetical protein
MDIDGVIVGLNWDQNGIGYECQVKSLLENFSNATNKKELNLSNY